MRNFLQEESEATLDLSCMRCSVERSHEGISNAVRCWNRTGYCFVSGSVESRFPLILLRLAITLDLCHGVEQLDSEGIHDARSHHLGFFQTSA